MTKKIVSAVLLTFVAIALITTVVRNQGADGSATGHPQPTATPATSAPTGAAATTASSPAAASRLVAFYFHGTKRCTACNSIEQLTREALKPETDAGKVDIRSVNVDEAPNAHYAEDFQLTMRTVVLAEEAGGKVVRWKRLDECWDRFADPPDFLAYIQRSLAAFRDPAPAAP